MKVYSLNDSPTYTIIFLSQIILNIFALQMHM